MLLPATTIRQSLTGWGSATCVQPFSSSHSPNSITIEVVGDPARLGQIDSLRSSI